MLKKSKKDIIMLGFNNNQMSLKLESFIPILFLFGSIFAQQPVDSLSNYHPLHKGNVWIYAKTYSAITYPNPPTGSVDTISRTVHDDTIISAKRWVIIEEKNITTKGMTFLYEFYDSSTTNFFQNNEQLDSTAGGTSGLIFGVHPKKLEKIIVDTVLGSTAITREISSPFLIGAFESWKFSYGIGLTHQSFSMDDYPPYRSSTILKLLYANINGKEYGVNPLSIDYDNDMISPKHFSIFQNYPNPFNPSTIINYTLSHSVDVTIKIFDILGREISTVVNNHLPVGQYSVHFNGSSLAGGIYFYQFRADGFVSTKRMLLLK